MERKIKYEEPSMESIMLGIEDVITTSGLGKEEIGSGMEFPWPGSSETSVTE